MNPKTALNSPGADGAPAVDLDSAPTSVVTGRHPAVLADLGNGSLELTGRLRDASNATFVGLLTTETDQIKCVYKPIQGERPLWDFPTGTLAFREVAAYLVSAAAGLDVVPVTVLAEAQFGPGSLQAWVDTDETESEALVNLIPSEQLPATGWFEIAQGLGPADQKVSVIHADLAMLRRICLLDVLINNADRKGGHILGSRGAVFGVDHGVCFHTEPKLRTLLWGWAGAGLDEAELAATKLVRDLDQTRLATLLAAEEIDALQDRADRLLQLGTFPQPGADWPAIPWPPF